MTATTNLYGPVIADTIARTAAWIGETPEQELPRAIGEHSFTIGAATGERLVFPCLQGMARRPFDHYRGASAQDKQALDRCLARFDGRTMVNLDLPYRLTRRNSQLYQA